MNKDPDQTEQLAVTLSEEQLSKVVEEAVEMVFRKMYEEVGRGALTALKWIGIVLLLSLLGLLASMGKIRLPPE